MSWLRPSARESWTWTGRFTVGTLLSLLFAAVQLNWFGLLPHASEELFVQAAVLTLAGLFALRVSPVGMALGLSLAFIAIFVDQATAGIGITPLRFTPPSTFWTVTLPRVVITWAAFPLMVWALGRVLPRAAGGVVIALALLPLPFIRYDDPGAVVSALATPGPGRYVVLPVPWLALCIGVAVLASIALVATRRGVHIARPLLGALAAVTLVLPLGTGVVSGQRAASGLVLEPASGGPLTEVRARATFTEPGTPIFTLDGQRILRNQFLFPLRTGVTGNADAAFLPGASAILKSGPHIIAVQLSGATRQSSYELAPAGGISLSLDADRHLLARGSAGAPVRILVDGADGPELLNVLFDASGSWRSPLALPTGSFRIVAQSASAWNTIDVP